MIAECHFHLVDAVILQQCQRKSLQLQEVQLNCTGGRPDKPSHQKPSVRFDFAHTDQVCGLYSISKVFTQQS